VTAEAGDDVDDSADSGAAEHGQLEESDQQPVSAREGTKCNSEVKRYGLGRLGLNIGRAPGNLAPLCRAALYARLP